MTFFLVMEDALDIDYNAPPESARRMMSGPALAMSNVAIEKQSDVNVLAEKEAVEMRTIFPETWLWQLEEMR